MRLQIQKLVLDFDEFLKSQPIIESQVQDATLALKLAKERYIARSGLLSELDQAERGFIKTRENEMQMRFKILLSDILLKQTIAANE